MNDPLKSVQKPIRLPQGPATFGAAETDTRQAREELRESAEWLAALTNTWHDVVVEVSANSSIVFVSASSCVVLGYEPREMIGRQLLDLVHPDDRRAVLAESKRAFATMGPTRVQHRLQHRNGDWRWFDSAGTWYQSHAGEMRGIGLLRDVTEGKQVEAALRDSEERLKIMFEFAPDAYFLSDLTGTFVDGNRAAEAMVGYDRKELIGKNFLKLSLLTPDQLPRAAANLAKSALGKTSGPSEFVLTRKDGSRVTVEIRTFPVRIQGRRLRLGIARDITERKQVEEALRALSLEHVHVREEERRKLALDIHDKLGQMLTALRMDLSRLQRTPPDSQQALREAVAEMLDICDNTLSSARRLSQELRPSILDNLGLGAAIEGEARTFEKRSNIQCQVTLRTEEGVVDGDRAIVLFRILQEALTNVARHAEASRVRVELSEGDGTLELRVRDDGKGFVEGRTGSHTLGLLGMRERATACGGGVTIQSAPNRGTTVTAWLPMLGPDTAAE